MAKKSKRQAYLDEIERLRSKLGKKFDQNPKAIIVKEASKEDSPLHDYFEWDDTAAGHKYRLMQAGELIRECDRITVTNPISHIIRESNRYIYDEKNGIVDADQVLNHPAERGSHLEMLTREWEGYTGRYISMLVRAGNYSLATKIESFMRIVRAEVFNTTDNGQKEAGH